MIEIGIDGTQYSLRTELANFNIKEGRELHNIIFEAPENLTALYNCSTQEEIDAVEVSDEDHIKLFPEFYGKVIAYCANVPDEVMGKCLTEARVTIYMDYLYTLIRSMIHLPEHIEEIDGITIEDTYYELPLSREMLGETRMAHDMTAVEFAEEKDLKFFQQGLAGGKYEYAANIVSILARPVGEKYDEKTCLDRVPMFEELPLDIYHSVFFSLTSSMQKFTLSMLTSLLPQELNRLRQLQART